MNKEALETIINGDNLRARLITLILNEGFLHGSPGLYETLSPQKAICNSKKSGNQTAVFITRSITIAAFKSFVGGKSNVGSLYSEYKIGGADIGFYGYNGDISELPEYGYIYTFKNAKAQQLTDDSGFPINEFVFTTPKVPDDIIRIHRNSLKELKVKITSCPEALRLKEEYEESLQKGIQGKLKLDLTKQHF